MTESVVAATTSCRETRKPYRNKIVKYWDSITLVYCKDHANGEAGRTAAESSKEMSKELDNNKEPAGSSSNSSSHKRQRSSDSFNSMLAEKLDMFVVALKDDGPKLPSSAEVLDALEGIEGLDEDTQLDLYDILTADACKFESMMALPPERRRRWLLKQLK
jgi:hypothetical protein